MAQVRIIKSLKATLLSQLHFLLLVLHHDQVRLSYLLKVNQLSLHFVIISIQLVHQIIFHLFLKIRPCYQIIISLKVVLFWYSFVYYFYHIQYVILNVGYFIYFWYLVLFYYIWHKLVFISSQYYYYNTLLLLRRSSHILLNQFKAKRNLPRSANQP